MDLYEHQGKELFAKHGIPLVEGFPVESAAEARQVAQRLGGRVAVKAQVQIGGRGGTQVTRVLVERLVEMAEQFYAAITLDRSSQRYLAMVSAGGGMDIEELARVRPETIRRSEIDPLLGLRSYQARYLVGHLP